MFTRHFALFFCTTQPHFQLQLHLRCLLIFVPHFAIPGSNLHKMKCQSEAFTFSLINLLLPRKIKESWLEHIQANSIARKIQMKEIEQ